MPEPNRHFSAGGLIGLLLYYFVPTWWMAIIGFLQAFLIHYPLDIIFQEYWDRTQKQTVLMGLICGTFLLFSFIIACKYVGVLVSLIMLAGSVGMDLIDETLVLLGKRPIFGCHPKALGYKEPQQATETFIQTLTYASLSSLLMAAAIYIISIN